MALVRPPPPKTFTGQSLQQQLSKLIQVRAQKHGYEHDIGQLTERLKARNVTRGQLGHVLEQMGRQSELMPELVKNDDEDFALCSGATSSITP